MEVKSERISTSQSNGINTSDTQLVYHTVRTTEMHTGGEPLRIIESGYPLIPGETIIEKLRYVKTNLDHLRKFLMWEPRGHNDMFGALLLEPSPGSGADLAVLFMHNDGYATMCGHGTIALARYAVDHGYVRSDTDTGSPEIPISIQPPCGVVKAYVHRKTGAVRFHSVPAFVFKTDVVVKTKKYGPVTIDISYGGGFYAFVTASTFGIDLKTANSQDIVDIAHEIKEATTNQVVLYHPDSPDLAFLFGVILTDGKDAFSEEATTNFCVFGEKEVDRCPCGSGTTARVALLYHRGHMQLNQKRQFVSGTAGSAFTGMVVRDVTAGEYSAVVVEISGQAFYTGKSEFTLEEGDSLGKGFLLR